MNIRNNTILVTGGTSGFGLEFAKQLLSLDNTVIITGRDKAKLEQTKILHPALHIYQSDVSDPMAIKKLYENVIADFPNLNIVINNAGEMRKINLHDRANNVDNIAREIEINLSGPIRMIQQFLPHLKSQKISAILNVTSGLALTPFPVSPIYGATKSGLRSYTKSLRVQMKNTNVHVFELIAPAGKTPLLDKFATDINRKSLMDPAKIVASAIQGLKNDNYEIYPGLAKALRIMSRLAPAFLLKQLSKRVDHMITS